MHDRRRTWDELTKREQEEWRVTIDLEPDETMEQWWEIANDAIEEDGSYMTEGWL